MKKTEVKELTEDPMVEGLQEPLEFAVTQDCSIGEEDQQELCGPATADSGLLEGQVEQL